MNKFLSLTLLLCSSSLWAYEWSGNINFETKHFTEDGLSSSQFKEYGSVSIQPEWFHQWDGGKQIFKSVAKFIIDLNLTS